MPKHFQSTPDRKRLACLEREALRELDEARAPLFEEIQKFLRGPGRSREEAPHLCCRRALNQMRISPLEARAIARAFQANPGLKAKLPAVLRRLRAELAGLQDTTERQNFDCPLLEGTRCLVHYAAKPIGCAAWNPGREFSPAGWKAFAERDKLNDRVYGPDWKLRVIPLWLKRAFKLRRLTEYFGPQIR